MDIIGTLKAYDIALFKFINIGLYNHAIAAVIKIIANDITVVVVLAVGLYFMARNFTQKAKLNLSFGLWALITTNIICNFVIKPFFKRPRPVVDIPGMHSLAWVSYKSYAFPSTHAAMAMAITVVLWDDYKGMRPWMVLFNLGLAFFCVYTGGHYPADVAGGMCVGLLIGFVFNLVKSKVKI